MPADLAVVHDADQAAALVQPERARLLAALAEPDSAAGLARRFQLPRQRLNYHLRELEKTGLVELVEERRKGNCIERVLRATARRYVIDPAVLGALGRTDAAAADRFSATYLVSTAARIIREVAALLAKATAQSKRVSTLTLETEIRFASAEARARFTDELVADLARLTTKYHDESAAGGRRFRLVSAVFPKLADPASPPSAPRSKEQ